MKKNLLFAFAGVLSITGVYSQNIAAARSAAVGTTVTVRGIVTNGPELGIIRFIQDPSAGITAYGAGLAPVNIGDSITVVGPTFLYNNLLEISPINSFTVHASGKPVPTPNTISPAALNETVEGTLIRINNGTFSASGSFAGNTNYMVTSLSQTFEVRIASTATNIVGTPIPSVPVDIIGLASQYCFSPTTGCLTGYQMYPRTLADIIASPTGISEKEAISPFVFYPNPARDELQIKSNVTEPIINLIITNFQGKTIYTSKGNIDLLDISMFRSGVYNVTILTEKDIYHSKLIIE
jgi:hypothetical protein